MNYGHPDLRRYGANRPQVTPSAHHTNGTNMTSEEWSRLTPAQQAWHHEQWRRRQLQPPGVQQRQMPAPRPFVPAATPSRGLSPRRWALIGGAVVLLIALGVGGFLVLGGSSISMTGSLILNGVGGSCVGTGGYSDIGPGTSVTVYDDTSKVVAIGALGTGKALSDTGSCVYPFQISDIPGGAKFYQVEVSHRGKLTYSRDDVLANKVALTLGSF